MSFMQVKIVDGEPVASGPIMGFKPENPGEIWLPVIQSNEALNTLYQTRKYIINGGQIIEIIETDETKVYLAERKARYPSIEEQLDILYHKGVAGWKSSITKIKTQFPKPDLTVTETTTTTEEPPVSE